MNYFDFILLGLVVLSVAAGFVRGFVTEAVSLIRWTVVILAGAFLTPLVVETLASIGKMISPTVFYWSVFVILVIAAFYIMMLVGETIGSALMSLRLHTADKFMGALFGLLRGLIFAIIFTLAFSFTSLPESDTFKRTSVTYEPMKNIINTVFIKLPGKK